MLYFLRVKRSFYIDDQLTFRGGFGRDRQIKQVFGNDISADWINRLKAAAELTEIKAGEVIMQEGDVGG